MPEKDPSTLSNYFDFSVKETRLSLKVLFDEKTVSGSVTFLLHARANSEQFVLDTSFLKISKVEINADSDVGFELAERKEPLGSALYVPYKIEKNEEYSLSIDFSTSSECTALQFLEKEATDDEKAPYLFSQCQPIHARSLFPCFDTPSVKSVYKMEVDSPYPSLMSGRFLERIGNKYIFEQPIPIPSYLVAIGSGAIVGAPIGPRSKVYSEPSRINACQHEFEADMEKFLITAEKLVFPYEWKLYDALVLPSSFPYGGMENPNITFVTPTLISGDRENIDVIAHELAHSWSGNLVTNCSWEHFWLNEGWTVYLERRIQGSLHGEPMRHFSAIIGWNDLENAIASMRDSAKRYSTLVQNLKDNSDPDDAFSTVPYEKGSTLLYHIEQVLGGKEVFDPFIPYYFSKFKYKSLDTYQFLDTLYDYFKDKKDLLDTIDWDAWLFKPGMPPVKPNFDSSLADQCYALADKWYSLMIQGEKRFSSYFSGKDIAQFQSNQSVVFLDALTLMNKRKGFKWVEHKDALESMTELYHAYSMSTNAEVLFRWYILQVTGRNTEFYDKLGEWLGTIGRMKFVRPGYVLLGQADYEKALKYFRKFELRYHPICRAMVKKDLGLK